jgi:hypothetical protein
MLLEEAAQTLCSKASREKPNDQYGFPVTGHLLFGPAACRHARHHSSPCFLQSRQL